MIHILIILLRLDLLQYIHHHRSKCAIIPLSPRHYVILGQKVDVQEGRLNLLAIIIAKVSVRFLKVMMQ